jgi:hypothetical protein
MGEDWVRNRKARFQRSYGNTESVDPFLAREVFSAKTVLGEDGLEAGNQSRANYGGPVGPRV